MTAAAPVDLRFTPSDEATRRDPYALYARGRREEPYWRHPGFPVVSAFRYADVQAILKDADTWSSDFRPIRALAPEEDIGEGAPPDPYSRYKQSIHGQAVLKSGLVVSAVCNDCHGTHDILPHTDPAWRINQANMLKTCGGCHSGVLAQFEQSVHGQALKSGAKLPSGKGGPTCTVCHHSHSIMRVTADEWKLHNLEQCGGCHTDRVDTYRETYHGQVTALGYAKVAHQRA